jgi:short-subunit dehydrogenase
MKQTILVTGASSGFGLLIANKLYQTGYNVIGTSRNPDRYQGKVPFKLLALDIADNDSIESFSRRLFMEVKQLDVLINNAGYLLTGLAEETAVELGRQQLETNFWGTVRLTNELLPHFRKIGGGKIITIGSMIGLISLPNVAYYSASKHALEGYFKALRFELKQFNISVSMVEPMGFKTNIASSSVAASGEIKEYDTFRKKINLFTKRELDTATSPEPVINKVMRIIKEVKPRYSYPVGKGASMILTMQRFAYNFFERSILKSVEGSK